MLTKDGQAAIAALASALRKTSPEIVDAILAAHARNREHGTFDHVLRAIAGREIAETARANAGIESRIVPGDGRTYATARSVEIGDWPRSAKLGGDPSTAEQPSIVPESRNGTSDRPASPIAEKGVEMETDAVNILVIGTNKHECAFVRALINLILSRSGAGDNLKIVVHEIGAPRPK